MKYVFLIFSLFPRILCSQYHFDFENDTTGWQQVPDGRWECSMERPISGAYSLHHRFDNQKAGCDFLMFTHDPVRDTDSLTLSFRVRHGYPPSSDNNWQISLLTEFSVLSEQVRITEGLVLGVNFIGSDDLIKLWECRDGECFELCTTFINFQEQVGSDAAPEFRIEWCKDGRLTIYFSRDPGEFSFEQIGTSQLDSLPGGRQLVVRYEYSSARDRNLWLDDLRLKGTFVSDTLAPEVTASEVVEKARVHIFFSEEVLLSQPDDFQLSGTTIGSLVPQMVYPLGHGLILEFPRELPNREILKLRMSNICDMDANCLSDTVILLLRNEAVWGDVVFNELMLDPAPVVLLPEEEYVEIFNRSEYELDLEGWQLVVNDRNHSIPQLLLQPSAFGLVFGITLPNDGATLALYSESKELIHSVKYEVPWDGPDWKQEGGWSLESPDPHRVCTISELWEYSTNPLGGTPGEINSNLKGMVDLDPPLFLYAGYGDKPGNICLQYSEPIFLSHEIPNLIKFLPGKVIPDSVATGSPISDQLLLWFPETLLDQQVYTLQLPGIADCSDNLSRDQKIQSGKIRQVGAGSILINEIMFDPLEGSPEYIEIYHPGEGFYDLRELAVDLGAGDISSVSPVPLSKHSRLIAPGEYLVVCQNAFHLMDAYNLELSGQWIGIKGLRELNNSEGTVLLTTRDGGLVDQVVYGDHMHMDLVEVTRGISLERISVERSGSDPANWHSAASIEGYATPGRKNSQNTGEGELHELVRLEPQVFSPDNNGILDLLEITISPGSQGWVISIWITDLTGSLVRNLANNHLGGPSLTYTWDGERENGKMAAEGFYVVHVRGYHQITGEKWSRKRAVGVIYP